MHQQVRAGRQVLGPAQVVGDSPVVVLAVDVQQVDRAGTSPAAAGCWAAPAARRRRPARRGPGSSSNRCRVAAPPKSRPGTNGSTATTRRPDLPRGRGQHHRGAALVAADLDHRAAGGQPDRPRPTAAVPVPRSASRGCPSPIAQAASKPSPGRAVACSRTHPPSDCRHVAHLAADCSVNRSRARRGPGSGGGAGMRGARRALRAVARPVPVLCLLLTVLVFLQSTGPDLVRHQAGPRRRPGRLPRPGAAAVEPGRRLRRAAEPGVRLPVPAGPVLRRRPAARAAARGSPRRRGRRCWSWSAFLGALRLARALGHRHRGEPAGRGGWRTRWRRGCSPCSARSRPRRCRWSLLPWCVLPLVAADRGRLPSRRGGRAVRGGGAGDGRGQRDR